MSAVSYQDQDRNEESKRLGYLDAIRGLDSKENQNSWYYQGYVEGQITRLEEGTKVINQNVKELTALISLYRGF